MLKKSYDCVAAFIDSSPIVRLALVFSFFALCFVWVYLGISTVSSIDDHYFHIRFAEVLRRDGFFSSLKDFQAIHFSHIADGAYLVYYNILFYIALIPFTYVAPLYLGLKLYAVFAAATALTLVYVLMRQLSIRHAFLRTFFFAAVTGSFSIWRLFLSRPYVLAPVLLLAIVVSSFKKKYWIAGVLSFIYFFWHSLTFFFPLCVGVGFWFLGYFYERKYNWRALLAPVGGIAVAISVCYLIAPGFFIYVNDVVIGTFRDTLLGKSVHLPEGTEVYPIGFFNYVNQNIFIFTLYVVSIVVYLFELIKGWPTKARLALGQLTSRDTFLLLSFFFSIVLFVGTVLVSKRFGDFFIFFAWLFISLIASRAFESIQIKRAALLPVGVGFVIAVTYLFANNLILVKDQIATGSAPEEFKRVGEWLSEHTPKGAIIFNTSWNWFPQLYYWSPNNNYIVGIEPRFMYEKDPELFWTWYHIAGGYVCDTETCDSQKEAQKLAQQSEKKLALWRKEQGDAIAKIVAGTFKSQHILSSVNFSALNDVLDHNNHFEKVYSEDNLYIIYQVKEPIL